MALNKEAAATITMNGQNGPLFKIERSVCQGCPLAPYLFLFVADVLRYMLDDPKWQVQGLTLSDNSSLNNQMFADDTALFLKGSPENLTRAMRALTRFCEAYGAKINWYKICAIWAS